MTVRRRVAIAAGCTAAIIAIAWAAYRYTPAAVDGWRAKSVAREPSARGGATRPTLWLLSIGISHYKHADINLQFGDKDAEAMAVALQSSNQQLIYAEVKSLVLTNEKVTRESILKGVQTFLMQAGPDDVAAIFMAGHGVQDRATGSYYFLPYPANGENLLTEGLRMSDFDEMIRVLRRNVGRVVVMLDTCHAGALRLTSRSVVSADDLATQMSVAEGLFVLAATKPGEESKEKTELGHGAFTYALLKGLQGAADADDDGVVTVSDLFGYVARYVPRLTAGGQHPYHKIEGTDLNFAAVQPQTETKQPLPTQLRIAQVDAELVATPVANSIAVMEFRNQRSDDQPNDWRGKALQVAFNTELSKVRALRVHSPESIERAMRGRGLDPLQAAQQLGIGKFINGSFAISGGTIRIDAWIVSTADGFQEAADSVRGEIRNESVFFDLQKELVLKMLRRMPVEVSTTEGKAIKEETNTSVDAYRLLLDAEGVSAEPNPTPSPSGNDQPTTVPQRGTKKHETPDHHSRLCLSGVAYAAEPAGYSEADVRQFLEEYRRAHEDKDFDRLAALYVAFSARQRDATRAYLENADKLMVEIADVQIEPHEHDVSVSYTRRDNFIDRASGKPARVEVRLTKTLTNEGGRWRIAAAP